MENKQTAVEWAEDEMSKLYYEAGNISFSEYHKKRIEIWEQAKQMEKEQIINAFGDKRQFIGFGDNDTFGISVKTGEQYYNETYGPQ